MGIVNINETLFQSIKPFNEISTIGHPNHSPHKPTYNVCFSTPPNILSDGIWGAHKTEGSPFRSSFPLFLLQVVIIYATTIAIKFPIKKLGLPILISQMMAGLILGPMVPVFDEYKRNLFPYGTQDTLATITALGYVLFLFETGVQMDLNIIKRTGRKQWGFLLFGLVIPMLIGYLVQHLKLKNNFNIDPFEAVIVIVGHNTTSLPVIYSLLNGLKLVNTELGRLALSLALIGDILSNIVLTIASIMMNVDHHIPVSMRLGSLVIMAIFILLIYRPVMFWIVEHTPEGREVKGIYIDTVIGIHLCLCWLSGELEIAPVFLPFIFGLATPNGPPLGSKLIKRVHLLGTKLFLPIFVATTTMKVEYGFWKSSSTSTRDIGKFVFIMGYVFKLAACSTSLVFFNMPVKDGVALVLILSCKGVVEVTMYSTALDRNDVNMKTYSVTILIIMVSICTTHLVVKCLYDPSIKYPGYENRNIFSLKPNSELKILVCIHKHHHITPMTEVIDLCYPMVKDPITVDALHLMELVGRSSPIFISHKKRKVAALNLHDSYSDNVVLSLELYEDDKQGAVKVNSFTAISPLNLMHEDVCHLALDKVSTIIVLPFHKKWLSDGNLEYDDKNIRSLNINVLETAPCSVGILVTRIVDQTVSSLRLALPFFGGRDDREALSLAKRAARDSSIDLVIYHIVDKNRSEEGILSKKKKSQKEINAYMDTVLDIEMLTDANADHSGMKNVTFREIEVDGGSQTLDVLHQIVAENDFIIVGRRHGINSPLTSKLHDYSEFPELGPVGDYLASSDLDCKASILVVQQQQQSR